MKVLKRLLCLEAGAAERKENRTETSNGVLKEGGSSALGQAGQVR